ncbi:MAG TPA: hypothetical protein VFT57_19340, partial [Gemmatimonadaceae bacterium]|nr:hypothetical protein [Gemmatimonadaceae bacterium]
RLEIDSDYFPSRVRLSALVRTGVRRAPIARCFVRDGAVSVMAVTVLAVPVPRMLMLTMLVSGGLVMRVRHGYLWLLVAMRPDSSPAPVTTLCCAGCARKIDAPPHACAHGAPMQTQPVTEM